MSKHRFCVGQNVRLIVRSCFEYPIKSIEEQFVRVAKEHELRDGCRVRHRQLRHDGLESPSRGS
jgi:hypothetical protein